MISALLANAEDIPWSQIFQILGGGSATAVAILMYRFFKGQDELKEEIAKNQREIQYSREIVTKTNERVVESNLLLTAAINQISPQAWIDERISDVRRNMEDDRRERKFRDAHPPD